MHNYFSLISLKAFSTLAIFQLDNALIITKLKFDKISKPACTKLEEYLQLLVTVAVTVMPWYRNVLQTLSACAQLFCWSPFHCNTILVKYVTNFALTGKLFYNLGSFIVIYTRKLKN